MKTKVYLTNIEIGKGMFSDEVSVRESNWIVFYT